METLKFTIIKNKEQYDKYCDILEDLTSNDKNQDEIDLLTLLIEKWDSEHNTFNDSDPVELLKVLMLEHNLKAKDLIDILDLSKGTISKLLNYHKGLSKDTIRKLSAFFKVSQEAFNRPYKLKNEAKRHFENARLENARLENAKKKMAEAK
jgi:HTH-type transcriptional regulator/antitoxin HigA